MLITEFLNSKVLHQFELGSNVGHEVGICMNLRGKDVMYVPIPKNASVWCNKLFFDYHFIHDNYLKNPHTLSKKPIIVLRDPFNRWVSGFCEFLYRSVSIPNQKNIIPLLDDVKIFEKMVFDEHTEKQIFYIKDILHLDCQYFYLDNTFEYSMTYFARSIDNGRVVDTSRYGKHTSVGNNFKKKVILQLQDVFKNNILYKKMIEDFYREDYALINRIRDENKFIRYQQ